MDTNYISQERYEELVAELQELKTAGRQEVAERLKFAKELGDLSENSEYKEARESQGRVEARIFELEELLRSHAIIKKTGGSSTVKIGSKVKVKKGKEIISYSMVGSSEASPGEGKISNESPIGRALLGKAAGESIVITTPKGEVKYEILDIE